MSKALSIGLSFVLGIGVGWIVQGRHWDVFLTSYIPSLATLAAAFYGAKFAFQFQNNKEAEDTKNRNVINGNSTLFNLMRMSANLTDIKKQVIDPVRKRPARFLEMQPTPPFDENSITLYIENLYFLFELDNKNLLGELAREEMRFRSIWVAINRRSEFHMRNVQPILDQAGFVHGGDYSIEQFKQKLGNLRYITLCRSTEQIISLVDSTIVSLKQVADRLALNLKKKYPDATIINYKTEE